MSRKKKKVQGQGRPRTTQEEHMLKLAMVQWSMSGKTNSRKSIVDGLCSNLDKLGIKIGYKKPAYLYEALRTATNYLNFDRVVAAIDIKELMRDLAVDILSNPNNKNTTTQAACMIVSGWLGDADGAYSKKSRTFYQTVDQILRRKSIKSVDNK